MNYYINQSHNETVSYDTSCIELWWMTMMGIGKQAQTSSTTPIINSAWQPKN